MKKNNIFIDNKFIKLHKYYNNPKNVLIFYIGIILLVICLIIGITLLATGASEYSLFVSMVKATAKTELPNISKFIYGLFFTVMAFLLIITLVLFGNSTFNKKLNNQQQ